MRNFCITHRRALMTLSIVSAVFTVCLLASACNAPAWLTDAEALIPILGSSVTSVLSFIAALTGNAGLSTLLNQISTIITDVGNGLTELESLITQYKSSPTDTLLQQIEQIANLVSTNLNQILAATGLPASIEGKIQAWAQLALSQLEAWLGILPTLKVAVTSPKKLAAMARPADDRLMTSAQLKEAFNTILDTPTGDASVDQALRQAPRV